MAVLIRGVLVAFLVLASGLIQAQSAGYQGKKLALGVDVRAAFNFYDSDFLDYQLKKRPILIPSFEADYVISRRGSIGIDFEQVRVGRTYGNLVDNNGTIQDQFLLIDGLSWGVHYRSYFLYQKGALAPVGNYIEYYVANLVHSGRLTDADRNERRNLYNDVFSLSFGVGFGKQRVLFDRFTLKTEFKAGLNLPLLNDPPTQVSNRMLFVYVFNLNVGLGALVI